MTSNSKQTGLSNVFDRLAGFMVKTVRTDWGCEMRKAVIHWEVDGRTGHGEPVSVEDAVAWVGHLNEEHGAGTHWYVLVEGG